MERLTVVASTFGQPFCSSHLDTGYITIAISNPKESGMNNVFPTYRIIPAKKTVCINLAQGTAVLWGTIIIHDLIHNFRVYGTLEI
jgi:hypothetical protein